MSRRDTRSGRIVQNGVSLAFGLTVLTLAYAIGHISGCHLNPAVTVGLTVAGRFPGKDVPGYVIAPLIGATMAAGILYVVASGAAGFDVSAGFAANGYGDHSPGGYRGAYLKVPRRLVNRHPASLCR